MPTNIKKVLFVLNPISGGIDKSETEEELIDFSEEHFSDVRIYKTTGNDDGANIETLIHTYKPDAVVAVGGDGTVNLVGVTLINKKIPLGIVPLGSGNGLSKDLGIPQGAMEALSTLVDGQIREIDTLTINNKPSLHLSDLGFNALIVKRFDEGESRGPTAYAWNVMKEYVGYTSCYYEVITDSDSFKGKAFMLTIANANMFGSNATVNPEGELNDGYFEVCILEEFPKSAGIAILYQMFSAEIHKSLHSKIIKCKEAIIRNPEMSPIQIDGEPVETCEELKVKILPKSLKVIIDQPL